MPANRSLGKRKQPALDLLFLLSNGNLLDRPCPLTGSRISLTICPYYLVLLAPLASGDWERRTGALVDSRRLVPPPSGLTGTKGICTSWCALLMRRVCNRLTTFFLCPFSSFLSPIPPPLNVVQNMCVSVCYRVPTLGIEMGIGARVG